LADIAKQYGIQHVKDNAALVRGADVVILAVKPQIMGDPQGDAPPWTEQLLISIRPGGHTEAPRAWASRAPHPRHPNTPPSCWRLTAIARADGSSRRPRGGPGALRSLGKVVSDEAHDA